MEQRFLGREIEGKLAVEMGGEGVLITVFAVMCAVAVVIAILISAPPA